MPHEPPAHDHDPALTALAAKLQALAPAAPGLARDEVLFRAGKAAAPRPSRWWAAATAASLLLALGLGVALYFRPAPPTETVVQTVVVPAPVPVLVRGEPTPSPGPESFVKVPEEAAPEPMPAPENRSPYQRLQEHLLRWGFDGLERPHPPEPPKTPMTPDDLLKSL